jgi:hypothetical protein
MTSDDVMPTNRMWKWIKTCLDIPKYM